MALVKKADVYFFECGSHRLDWVQGLCYGIATRLKGFLEEEPACWDGAKRRVRQRNNERALRKDDVSSGPAWVRMFGNWVGEGGKTP